MGTAILAGIRKKYAVCVCETDSKRRQFLKRKYRVAVKNLEDTIKQSKVIILAVKPQSMTILNCMKGSITKDKLIISIAAGITTSFIEIEDYISVNSFGHISPDVSLFYQKYYNANTCPLQKLII